MLDSGDNNEPPKRRGGPTKAEIAAKTPKRHNSKGGRGKLVALKAMRALPNTKPVCWLPPSPVKS